MPTYSKDNVGIAPSTNLTLYVLLQQPNYVFFHPKEQKETQKTLEETTKHKIRLNVKLKKHKKKETEIKH